MGMMGTAAPVVVIKFLLSAVGCVSLYCPISLPVTEIQRLKHVGAIPPNS